MKKVFLFHGLGGSPESNWLPWIQQHESFKNVEFVAPRFPHPKKPVRAEWVRETSKLIPEDVSDTYLVGHSLGGAFIIYLLQQWHGYMPFAGALFISAPFEGPEWEHREDLQNFRDIPFSQVNFSGILEKVQRGKILHAKDDAVVPFSNAEKYKETLGFDLILTETGKHFTGTEHEEVRLALENLINEN